jgi:hypothetical protein
VDSILNHAITPWLSRVTSCCFRARGRPSEDSQSSPSSLGSLSTIRVHQEKTHSLIARQFIILKDPRVNPLVLSPKKNKAQPPRSFQAGFPSNIPRINQTRRSKAGDEVFQVCSSTASSKMKMNFPASWPADGASDVAASISRYPGF